MRQIAYGVVLGGTLVASTAGCDQRCDAVDTEAYALVHVVDAATAADVADPTFTVDGKPVNAACETFLDGGPVCDTWNVPVGDGVHTLGVGASGYTSQSASVDTGMLGGSGPCASGASQHASLTVSLSPM
jgi:hypothetical protein